MEEVLVEEPTATTHYIYPPPLYPHRALIGDLFYKFADFVSIEEDIGEGQICYPDMPNEVKRQKVYCCDDDKVTQREDQANYFHP